MYTQYPRRLRLRFYDTQPQAITTEKEKSYPKRRTSVNAPSSRQRFKYEIALCLSALSRLLETRRPIFFLNNLLDCRLLFEQPMYELLEIRLTPEWLTYDRGASDNGLALLLFRFDLFNLFENIDLQSHIFISENSYTMLQRLDTPGPTYSPETKLQAKLVKHALDIEQSRKEGSKKARSRAAINKKNRHHKILPPTESFSDRSYQAPSEILSLTQEYDLWGQEKLAAWKESPGRAKDWKRCRLLKASKKGR
jgi:hypothetical protein